MQLVGEEIEVEIDNRYALTTYSFQFVNQKEDTHTCELRFELTIDPTAFINLFEANIDNKLYIGQIKQNKKNILSSKNNYDDNDIDNTNNASEEISISQMYKDVANIFEIKANVKNKEKISLKLCFSQYLQKKLNYYSLSIQILNSFKRLNSEKDFKTVEHVPFKISVRDINPIYDVKINGDDVKINSNGNSELDEKTNDIITASKLCKITGQIKTDITNEFIFKYKIDSTLQTNSHMFYNDSDRTFCHIINNSHIIRNKTNIIPRRVMFVIDRSGSMQGIKWDKTIQSIIYAIQLLRKNIDRFGVMLFNNDCKLLQDIQLATNDVCNHIINTLKTYRNVHEQTNINKTLLKTIKLIKTNIHKTNKLFYLNQIIFITDGDANVGENNIQNILNNVIGANKLNENNIGSDKISIYTFGIGSDSNDSEWVNDLSHSFLNVLAINNNGFYKRIKQNTADKTLCEYLEILSQPILLNLNIKYLNNDIYDIITNIQYGIFYNGSEIVICGKIKNKLNNNNKNPLKFNLYGTYYNTNTNEIKDISSEMMSIDIIIKKEININFISTYFKLFSYWNRSVTDIVLLDKDDIDIDNDNDEKFEYSELDLKAIELSVEYKLLTPWTYMNILLVDNDTGNEDENKPNINRIETALKSSLLSSKYNNLHKMFSEFVAEQEYSDGDMEHEFGDGSKDDCSFNDWLKSEKGIEDETQIDNIWCDLNLAFKGVYEDKSNIRPDRLKTEYDRMNYNIDVSDDQLLWIENELEKQCCDLRNPGQSGFDRGRKLGTNDSHQRELDRATYSLLQIGKQNHNKPLLMWLVDSFNRFRIQRRKRFKQKYTDGVVYKNKFSDIKSKRFISEKCRGFKKWLEEYPNIKQTHFKNMCDASINVFCHRLLPAPPMQLQTGAYIIKDKIIQIGSYILQCYNFIEQFTVQKNAPLPTQIDIVFIVKSFDRISWNEDDDDDDDDDDESDQKNRVNIGNIKERLKNEKNIYNLNGIKIGWRNSNRKMLTCVNGLISNTHNQRIVLIVDRRINNGSDNENQDILYAYQPNADKKCHNFETDINKFLFEGLIQNSRICILPKLDTEKVDIGINHNVNPECLTLSFHCFALNQFGVYLYYNGWGTRFFIDDIKYFLPTFFHQDQANILRHMFEENLDREFVNKYKKTKKKCADVQFERFYKALVDGKPPH